MPTDFKDILRKSPLFRHLNEAEIEALAANATEKQYGSNEVIVREGEVGDILYIIVSGNARVFTQNVNNEEIDLTRLQKGDYFGEQALLTEQSLRRNATVQTLTQVCVLTFTKDVLRKSLQADKGLQQLLEEHGQRQLITKLSKQFQDRTTQIRDLFSLFGGIESYKDKQIIFTQGDKPESAYLLLNGQVEIHIRDTLHHEILTSLIFPGQIFGEQAVIKDIPRAGTAVAEGDIKVIIINADALKEINSKSINLSKLLEQLMQTYELPSKGIMTRYRGVFLGKSSVQTDIKKPNGDILVVSHVSSADIFGVAYAINDASKVQTFHFEKTDNCSRDIQVFDNTLVGVISVGKWDDLLDTYNCVDAKIKMTPEQIRTFSNTGKLPATIPSKAGDSINIFM